MKNKQSRFRKFVNKHKKTLIKHITFHFVLFVVFLIIFFSISIESLDNGTRENICVEDKEYISGTGGTIRIEPKSFFYYGGNRYQLADNMLYTARAQYDEIQIGDTIEVIYVAKSDFAGEYRFVIDAKKSDGTQLVDYSSYYSEHSSAKTVILIVWLLIELIGIGISVFYFYIIK